MSWKTGIDNNRFLSNEILNYTEDKVYVYYDTYHFKFKNSDNYYELHMKTNNIHVKKTTIINLDEYKYVVSFYQFISEYYLELKDIQCFQKEYIKNQIKLLK